MTPITAEQAEAGKHYKNQKGIRCHVKGRTPEGKQIVLVTDRGREIPVPLSYQLFPDDPVADTDIELTDAQLKVLLTCGRPDIEAAIPKMTDDQLEAFGAHDGRMFVLDLVSKEAERRAGGKSAAPVTAPVAVPETDAEPAETAPCPICYDEAVLVNVSPVSGKRLLAPHNVGGPKTAYCKGSGCPVEMPLAPTATETPKAAPVAVTPAIFGVEPKAEPVAEPVTETATEAPAQALAFRTAFIDADGLVVSSTERRLAMIKGWYDLQVIEEASAEPGVNATVKRELERQASALQKVRAATTLAELAMLAAGDAAKARSGVRALISLRRADGALAPTEAEQARDAEPAPPVEAAAAEEQVMDPGARSRSFMAGRAAYMAGRPVDAQLQADIDPEEWTRGWADAQELVRAEPGFVKLQPEPETAPEEPVVAELPPVESPVENPAEPTTTSLAGLGGYQDDQPFMGYLRNNEQESGRVLTEAEADLVWRLSKDVRTSRAAMPEAKDSAIVQRALEFAGWMNRSETVIQGLDRKAASLSGERRPGPKKAAATPPATPVPVVAQDDEDGDGPALPTPTALVTDMSQLPVWDQVERSSIPRAIELVNAITDVKVLREVDRRSLYPEVHAAIETRRQVLMPGTSTWSGTVPAGDTVKVIEALPATPAAVAVPEGRRFQVQDCRLITRPDGVAEVWAFPADGAPFLVGPAARKDIAPLARTLLQLDQQRQAKEAEPVAAAQAALAALAAGLPALKRLGVSVTITITT